MLILWQQEKVWREDLRKSRRRAWRAIYRDHYGDRFIGFDKNDKPIVWHTSNIPQVPRDTSGQSA